MFAALVKPFEDPAIGSIKDAIKASLQYSLDVVGYFALAVTIALIIVLTATGFYFKNRKPEHIETFKKVTIGIIIGYSIAVIFSIGALSLAKTLGRGKKFIDFDGIQIWGLAESTGGKAQLYIYTFTLIIALGLIALLVGKRQKVDKTKSIVYGAVLIALSFALSYVKFFSLPQGGSITFASLVPLMLYSYMFGIRRGIIAGFIYGILQFFQGPYFVHPMQFLLDYPIAFAAIGVAGIFKEREVFKGKSEIMNFVLGAFLAVFLRYLSSVVAGIFVWGSYVDQNLDTAGNIIRGPVAWSFLYNAFTFGDLAIALVAGVALLSSKSFTTVMNQTMENLALETRSNSEKNDTFEDKIVEEYDER